MIVKDSPIIVPSMVLPLLIKGMIFLLPNNFPPKYAKTSIVLTKITTYKTIYNPLGLCKILMREKKEIIIKFDNIKFIISFFLYKRKIVLKKTEIERKLIKLLKNKYPDSISFISKIVKNKRSICNKKILNTCCFCKIFTVNFSYSKKITQKSIEKKIETNGFPSKNSTMNKNDNTVVEINLFLNSCFFIKDIMLLKSLIITTIFSYSFRII